MFLATTPKLGTVRKPTPIKSCEVSPYYWWWQYLKRNKEYLRCCENNGKGRLSKLYKDFGDVRSDDFRSWWYGKEQKGQYLFAEPKLEFTVKQLISSDEWTEDFQQANVAVVAINLSLNSRRAIKKTFNKWLKNTKAGKRGRPSVTRSLSRRPLARNFSTKNLKRILDIYDAVEFERALAQKNQIKAKPLWQIGYEKNVLKHIVAERAKDANARADLSKIVSRLYRRGKAIVANTANGVFPVG